MRCATNRDSVGKKVLPNLDGEIRGGLIMKVTSEKT